MTPKQEEFCRQYLIDLNATQAAIRAGYSAKTASESGARLLANVKVRQELSKLQAERSTRTDITADRVVKALAAIAFNDRRVMFSADSEVTPAGVPDSLEPAFEGVEPTKFGPKYKFASREKALELLGRHLGIFVDRVETKITEGQVTIYIPDNGRNKEAKDGVAN